MCEDAPCCGCCGQNEISGEIEEARHMSEVEGNAANWPGDGSGEDDLADYNQNEADDYSGED